MVRAPYRPRVTTPERSSQLGPTAIEIALQPIVAIGSGAVVAAEALARFPEWFGWPARRVFPAAHAADCGAELEAACLRAAFERRAELPASVALAVNVSPDAACDPVVQHVLDTDLTGVIIEIVESLASDGAALGEAIAEFRRRGALIAVDDTGSGYAGPARLRTLRPDLVKIDQSLVSGVHDNHVKLAVIEALVELARGIGARVVGEGVETPEDLRTLAELEVDYAQGWAIARPAPQLPADLSLAPQSEFAPPDSDLPHQRKAGAHRSLERARPR
jgi:EAL domain-containing protein (putative c-di-GMP-specific phosphodiesterase class I)